MNTWVARLTSCEGRAGMTLSIRAESEQQAVTFVWQWLTDNLHLVEPAKTFTLIAIERYYV